MKKKFKPNIRKVILNPEQAVLTCECYDLDTRHITGDFYWAPLAPRMLPAILQNYGL